MNIEREGPVRPGIDGPCPVFEGVKARPGMARPGDDSERI